MPLEDNHWQKRKNYVKFKKAKLKIYCQGLQTETPDLSSGSG